MIVGIDPSSKTLAVVVLQPQLVSKHKLRGTGRWEPQNAADAMQVASTLVDDVLGLGPDDHVFLEEPVVGRSIRPTIVQSYVSGVVQAVVCRSGAAIELVNNRSWKKLVVGNGNATKDDTKRFIRERHPRIASQCGDDDDLYDAAGLALYGASSGAGL